MFFEALKPTASAFLSISQEKVVKVISHNDADGICAAAIFLKVLLDLKRNFELRIIKHPAIKALNSGLENKLPVLLDWGSGQLNQLQKVFESGPMLILDHHQPIHLSHPNLLHLNPVLDGIEELPASMVTYLFAKAINPAYAELVDLAVVGGVGDCDVLKGEAEKIVEEGKAIGKIKVEKGIRLYGRYSRPIHKALEYSFDPYIPGISGSESNAVQFLSELGIEIRKNDDWRRLCDLSLEEQKKLASAIIIERLRWKEDKAEAIFGDSYILPEKPLELQDAKEFATLINACGRMDRADIALKICLGDKEALKVAITILDSYKEILARYLQEIRGGNMLKETENATYLFAEDKIKDTLLPPITSILLNSNLVRSDKPLIGFADSDGEVKVSARASDLKINLRDVIVAAAERVGGSGGGHRFAAGAFIPKGKEDDFVKSVEEVLSHGTKD